MGMYWNSPDVIANRINRRRQNYDYSRQERVCSERQQQPPTIIINLPQSVAQDVKREDEATKEIVGQAATAMNELASALNRLLKG